MKPSVEYMESRKANFIEEYDMNYFYHEIVNGAIQDLMLAVTSQDVELVVEKIFDNIGLPGFYKMTHSDNSKTKMFGDNSGPSFTKKTMTFVKHPGDAGSTYRDDEVVFGKSIYLLYLIDVEKLNSLHVDALTLLIEGFSLEVNNWFKENRP